jgi:hypothetical protein
MKGELSGIKKLEAVKATMEALGYDFSTMTVAEAFAMFKRIDVAVHNTMLDIKAERKQKAKQIA